MLELDPQEAYERAMKNRRELQGAAREMGVSEEFISELVDRFYDRVRQEPELGAVFNERIGDRWPDHLAKMKRFWSSIALRDGGYEGKPMAAHLSLEMARPEHFDIWTRLFEDTLRDTAPNGEVVEFFLGFAETMKARFTKRMFGA